MRAQFGEAKEKEWAGAGKGWWHNRSREHLGEQPRSGTKHPASSSQLAVMGQALAVGSNTSSALRGRGLIISTLGNGHDQ